MRRIADIVTARWVFTVVGALLTLLFLCPLYVMDLPQEELDWQGRAVAMLLHGSMLSIVAYAVVYPIYRGVRRLTTRGASKPHPVARTLWRLTLGAPLGALFILTAISMYETGIDGIGGRPRIAKAQADTRSIASAVNIYFHHCSGLPADSSRTDCPVAAETGGPHPLPKSLLVQQTNAQGQVGGPFLNMRPRLPAGWTGAGNSYAYTVLSDGKFLICAVGDSTGADSNGGAPTACP
jgi:hypothetical protein